MKASGVDSPAVAQQDRKATGVVKDAAGPIIGATIIEKGNASNGTTTDMDGKFSLNVKPGSTLVVSYVGYKSQEVKVGQAALQIVMSEDSKILGDVVVTALGIKKERKALGYGVDEVKGDALTKAKETNVINSMAGRVAGLVVSQTAGGPSGSTRVILRGSTEMTGNNQPLYVIDGVPLDNTNYGSAGTSGGFDLGDGISGVNADDIENVSVLKGPAASALYGSRASHGVILITTKRAKGKDSFSLEYNGTMTFDTQLAKWNDVQQVYGMGSNGTYSIDAVSNTNKSWGAKADGTNMLKYFDGVERPYLIIPNNTSKFFRTGLTATNTAIVSSTSGSTGVRFTLTDMRNKDIVPETHMSRDIFNLRTNTSLNKVDLDFGVTYTREDVKNRPALGDSKSNIGKNLMTLATTYDQEWLKTYQDENGEYSNWNGMDPYNVNPYWDIYKNSNTSKKDQFRLNGKATWNVTKHFKLQGTVGAELNWFTFQDYKAPTTPGFEAGRLQLSDFQNRMYNFEVLALYNNKWGDFDFNATLGGNVYKVNNQTTITTAQDMKLRDVTLMSFNETSIQLDSYRKQINSVYGAVNLGWKHLLYFDTTLRGDQSSTLPVDNNTYLYPSFSGSFVFSELTPWKNALPYGKLRMSWAQVGSDTDPYQLGLVYTKSKFTYPGYTIGSISNSVIPNKDLKPTKTNSFEMGLDMKFLKNRVGLEFTYYSQISKNQILRLASSWTSGYNYRLINAGEIENKGIEISLNTRPVEVKDFSWDVNLNFSKNRNKVKSLVDGMDLFELEKATWLDVQVAAKVGENYGSIVGPDFQRNANGDILINPQTGLPQYDKSNHVLGNASWDWTGGATTTLTYKDLSLSAIFDVKVGADLYSMSARAAYESGKSKQTLAGREDWYKSEEQRQAAGIAKGSADWKPTGGFVAPGVIDNGDGSYRPNDIYVNPEDYWMSVSRNAPSMFIFDNSYVKCREITLSYNLPKSWLKKTVKNLTLSFVARNPFIVWKNIPNIDPDSNYNNTTGMGLEYGSLPSRKSYGFNVNVKF
jgi:TonB-linked SusC/RagA family outer membrane protein